MIIYSTIVYFTPIISIMEKIIKDESTNHKRFLLVKKSHDFHRFTNISQINGMKENSYFLKIFFSNLIFIFIVISIFRKISFHINQISIIKSIERSIYFLQMVYPLGYPEYDIEKNPVKILNFLLRFIDRLVLIYYSERLHLISQ